MDWENHLQKIQSKKNKKTKTKVKLPHVNKNPLARKRIFVQKPFSDSTLKKRAKTFHAAKPIAFFHSISCLGVTKINTPI